MKYEILDTIRSPSDLKAHTREKLPQVANELRKRIIDVMSINGGHLSSNLGSVEIILAMHYVFNSPEDKMIFDTGHQIYPHKLLTGRHDTFDSIRQYQGQCGFTCPTESAHDHFYAGHAGTALSLSLGVANARDLNKQDCHVLPFICDAPFACGLTFEALNNIPKDLKKFTIVLNDNAWAISSGVGAFYHNILGGFSLPRKAKKEAKEYFEHFNLEYIGPVDGHDVQALVDVFEQIKESDRPVILHTLTTKGHGMPRASADPTTYHGAVPFDPESGKFHPAPAPKITFPKVFGAELLRLGEEDESIVALTPAMPRGSCLDPFMEKFPKRFWDVGIAEGHAVTYAGGLAYQSDKKVVASVYATFFQRALDNLFQDVCLQKLPVVFALDRGGLSPRDGTTHHGIFDIAFLNAMPSMVVTQPRNGDLLKDLLSSAFEWKRPTAIRYPNMTTTVSDRAPEILTLGKGEILTEGSEIAIIALGHMCTTALQVRDMLRDEGLEVTVVDPIFVKPLDKSLLFKLMQNHHTFVTLEEHAVNCGLGSIINNFLVQSGHQEISCFNFGIPDHFIEHGSHGELMNEMGLTPEKLSTQILNKIAVKRRNLDKVET